MKFAKLIDLPNNEQVLLTLNCNEDEDFEVAIRTDFEGCVASIKVGYETQDKALKMMDDYQEAEAILFRDSMKVMLF